MGMLLEHINLIIFIFLTIIITFSKGEQLHISGDPTLRKDARAIYRDL